MHRKEQSVVSRTLASRENIDGQDTRTHLEVSLLDDLKLLLQVVA